jgi:predicted NAD/FAD-binding protein
MRQDARLKVAIVGTGISGLSAAWLLSRRHDITVYERSDRVGGHSNTVVAPVAGQSIAVDTGFIVYNRRTYPNLTALFGFLGVPTQASDMSFAVSLDDGALEYSGTGLSGVFAQPRNLIRRRFWSMLSDLVRFYRQAAADAGAIDERISLGDYLAAGRYGAAFRDDHLLPMASAIWSARPADILSYPAAALVRFHSNHGLLQLRDHPAWETVAGGSRNYVRRLTRLLADRIRLDTAVTGVHRIADGVVVTDATGGADRYDHVVMATHADQALTAIANPTPDETELLGAFRYSRNLAVLHSDPGFMPRRRAAWSSWNYIGSREAPSGGAVGVTYWMNRLQSIPDTSPLFLTLNPARPPRAGTLHHSEIYDHPIFDAAAISAQSRLWSLQGKGNVWFCGAHFGAGFHEDGLQAGLAVAEQLGGLRRPWNVPNESGRIVLAREVTPETTPELQG